MPVGVHLAVFTPCPFGFETRRATEGTEEDKRKNSNNGAVAVDVLAFAAPRRWKTEAKQQTDHGRNRTFDVKLCGLAGPGPAAETFKNPSWLNDGDRFRRR